MSFHWTGTRWFADSITCGHVPNGVEPYPATPSDFHRCAASDHNAPTYFKYNPAPSAVSYTSPAEGATGVSTNTLLAYSATDPQGQTITYDVYLGTSRNAVAGQTSSRITTTATSITASSIAGALQDCTPYYWKVVARDPGGQSSIGTTRRFSTGSCRPTVAIDAEETYGRFPLTVDATAQASAASGKTITGYVWNFGDGTPQISNLLQVTHVYPNVGDYTLTFTATDSEGLSASSSIPIKVTFTAGPESAVGAATNDLPGAASAYDADNNRYLVVTHELDPFVRPYNAQQRHSLKGLIIDAALNASGDTIIRTVRDRFFITDSYQWGYVLVPPSTYVIPGEGKINNINVAYSTSLDQYLLVWEEAPAGAQNSTCVRMANHQNPDCSTASGSGLQVYDIRGQLLGVDGTPVGVDFLIQAGQVSPFVTLRNPRVAAGRMNGSDGFLVVWEKNECVASTSICQYGSASKFVTSAGSMGSEIVLPFTGKIGLLYDGNRFVISAQKKLSCTDVYCWHTNPVIAVFLDQTGTIGQEINVLNTARRNGINSTAIAYNDVDLQYFVVHGPFQVGDKIRGAIFSDYVSSSYYPPLITFPDSAAGTPVMQVQPSIGFDGIHYMVAWAHPVNATLANWRVEGVRMRADGSFLDTSPIPISSQDAVYVHDSYDQAFVSNAAAGVYDMLVLWYDRRAAPSRTYGVITHAATPVHQVLVPSASPPMAPIPGIDLVSDGLSLAPATLRSGVPFIINSGFRNDGADPSGQFSVRYDWSSVLPPPPGSQVHSQSFSGLGSQSTVSGPVTITPPASPEGYYFLTMSIDPQSAGNVGQVIEANEYNNVVTLMVNIDNTAPTVNLVYPQAGTVVSGPVTVIIDANDAFGVAITELYVDGARVYPTSEGAGLVWNAASVVPGAHVLTVRVYDFAGNAATSPPVTVQVVAPAACGPLRFTTTPVLLSAQHFLDLSIDISMLRIHAGMSPFSWTTAAPVQGQQARAQSLLDLRNNLQPALTALQQTITFTDGTATTLPANTRIKAIHLTELRTAIQAACGN